eukprot:4791764-Pyramimonas_sp.AAC.1
MEIAERGDRKDKPKESKDIAELDKRINSAEWWGKVLVLDHLYELIRDSLIWAEGCPCHSHLLRRLSKTEDLDLADKHILDRWKKCPLRGMRL